MEKIIITIAAVILGMGGMAGGSAVDSNSIVEDGIEYYIQTNKSVYDLGEDVELLYRVTNLRDEDVTFGFPHSPEWNFWVERDGGNIWRAVNGWWTVMTQFTLGPGDSKEFPTFAPPYIWDMRDDEDNLVNVGAYNVIGGLYAGTGEYDSTRVSVRIEIVPEPVMIYYVDADANGLNDGSSWADAYNYLQDALADVVSSGEIWVAQGIYTPDSNSAVPDGSGDRTATFQLINGITIKGGYAGFGEPDPNARDIDAYETILSGDLGGNDIEVNDPADLLTEPSRAENGYHVVTGSGTYETAVLDGFTITAGNANGTAWPNGIGGGMRNSFGSPTVLNCTFRGNSAKRGGGMDADSSAVLDCTFSGNSASFCGGAVDVGGLGATLVRCTITGNLAEDGGGISQLSNRMTTVVNCTITGNLADRGGGMFTSLSNPVLTNCTFSGNSARDGGAIYSESGIPPAPPNLTFSAEASSNHGGGTNDNWYSPTLNNCIFSGNLAEHGGGGMYNEDCDPNLINCTFAGNSALSGNALACDSWRQLFPSNVRLINCILWDDGDEIWNNDNSTITITYSDLQGGWLGEGNIDIDPLFVDAAGDNYHSLPDSPCIDAGDPNYPYDPNETDLDGKPRVIGGRIDMGAYEYSPPVPAEVRVVPRSINLASMGRWITCYIWLPEDYDVVDIDPNSVLLEGEIEAQQFWVDEQEQIAIARFNRSEVQDILAPGEVELTVSGELSDGTRFEGTDTIRIIDKGKKK